MKTHILLTALLALSLALATTAPWSALGQTGRDEDIVVQYDSPPVTGKVVSDTWKEVVVELRGGVGKATVSQEKVRDIQYSDAPLELTAIRSLILQGNYADALKRLQELKSQNVRGFWFDPYKAFYNAECLAGTGKSDDAVKAFQEFVQKYPEARFVPDAVRSLGRTYAKLAKFDDAKKEFERLAGGQYGQVWKYSGQFELADMLRAQGKSQEAAQQYQAFVTTLEGLGAARPPKLDEQLNTARIAIGRSLIAGQKYQEAFDYLSKLLKGASEFRKDSQATADAYNLLGDSCLGRNQDEEARYYYLHTYVLFPSARAAAKYALQKAYDITVRLWQKNKSDAEKKQAELFDAILKKDYAD